MFVLLTAVSVGLQEARLLLKDWLVNLTACYNEAVVFKDRAKTSATLETVDTSFSKIESMQFLARFIFALMKNPVRALACLSPLILVPLFSRSCLA
jgi:hypothetical protein